MRGCINHHFSLNLYRFVNGTLDIRKPTKLCLFHFIAPANNFIHTLSIDSGFAMQAYAANLSAFLEEVLYPQAYKATAETMDPIEGTK